MWHFFALHLWTILGLVASFGTIGLAVAVVAFGVPAALIVARLAAVAREALRFLSTPTGQAVAVVALCVASFVAGDVRRTRLDDAAWRAREQQVARAAAERDARIRQETATDAAQRLTAVLQEANELQQKVTDYERTISARNDRACLATPDDVRGLRDLAPQSEPGAGRGAGRLRKAPRAGRAAAG
jgi:signal transduction histidine kinase